MRGQSSTIPKEVSVRFQGRRCSGAPSATVPAWYVKTVSLSDAGFDEQDGFGGTKYINDTALALFSAGGTDPTNKSALDSLALQIATDYWNWLQVSFDETYPQIITPPPDSIIDTIEFHYSREKTFTRIVSTTNDSYPEELQHNDPANKDCKDAGTTIVSKTPCFESYGPMVAGTTNIQFNVFLNCIQDGLLTQKYIRTDSVGCGCAIPACSSFCVRLYTICPPEGGSQSFPNLTSFGISVALYKDGTFIANGAFNNGSARWCWNSIPYGTGYQVRIADKYPYIHEFNSPIFEITPECTVNDYRIYDWLGWSDVGAHAEACQPFGGSGGNPYEGVTIRVTQNGVVKSSVTDNQGDATVVGPFIDYFMPNYIPYPLTIEYVPTTDRWVTKTFETDWASQQPGFDCSVTALQFQPIGGVFVDWTCTRQGDVADGYICQASCDIPTKKQLQFTCSVYGSTILNYVGCDNIGAAYWEGTLTVTSPGCSKLQQCNGVNVVLNCPSQSVTIRIRYSGTGRGTLDLRWDTTFIPCGFPDARGLSCPQDGGENGYTPGGSQLFPPGRSFCGETFLQMFEINPVDYCSPNPLITGIPTLYPNGTTITLIEAP